MPKVAISSDFLTAFAKVPRSLQGKVTRFIENFKQNPLSSGINYENIKGAKEPNIRSVRIDQAYRGIVLKPEKGDVYVLLWVDNHDNAYTWAKNRVCKVHPVTGALQIFSVENQVVTEKAVDQGQKKESLLKDFKDKQFIRLGIPEELVSRVRDIESETHLESLQTKFPEDVYDVLYMLAAGFTEEEVYTELCISKAKDVDVSDFANALDHIMSKRNFYIVDDDIELKAMLNAPLEKWRVFLHPTQRVMVERHWNGPVRILGGAGTGKTVVAMHRAKWLAENVCLEKYEKVFFTTFTKNLAADIFENMKKICTSDVLRKIEVVNIDKWVSNYLKKNGYNYVIDYGVKSSELWEKALSVRPKKLDVTDEFLRNEWVQVVQAQGIETEKQYMRASRIGRGVRLDRAKRKIVWPVFEEYRTLLNENNVKEREDALRDCRKILSQKQEKFPFVSIVVDEAQDMGNVAFSLLSDMIADASDNLFIVGDVHQKIYRNKVVLSQCGINIRGRGRKLRINYRTTDEIRKKAVMVLENVSVDDLDGELDSQKGYRSLYRGDNPVIEEHQTFDKEIKVLKGILSKMNKDDLKNTCLISRTNALVERYAKALEEEGVALYHIRRSQGEDRSCPGIRLATMHRVKGLEFDTVIIAGLNEEVMPLRSEIDRAVDEMDKKDIEQRNRALLYVSMTRAKRQLIITSCGKMSELVKSEI